MSRYLNIAPTSSLSRTSATGRIAPLYDLATAPFEKRLFSSWRRRFWSDIPGEGRGLEVGVGTGANIPYHPPGAEVVGVDISFGMARRARRRGLESNAGAAGSAPLLVVADVERLPFREGTFDWAGETLVFCEVARPENGLAEITRVLMPGAPIALLEHVRPGGVRGRIADALTALTRRLWGEHLNRNHRRYVSVDSLEDARVEWIWHDVVALITGRAKSLGASGEPANH